MTLAPAACDRCKKYKKACNKRLGGCLRCTRFSVKCTYSPPAGVVQWSSEPSLGHILSRGSVEVENQVTIESRRIIDGIRREDLKSMVDTYFQTLNGWLPFVGRADFDTAFISYTEKPDAQQIRKTYVSHFSVLLLSMLLVAHLSSKTTVRNKEFPTKLYNATKSLYSLVQSSGKSSLELVQTGLNITAYEHCQARGHDAWLTIGGCARMAQMVGLHSTAKARGKDVSGAGFETDSGGGFETHKCVWWSVVVMERVVASELDQGMLPFASAAPALDDALPISTQDEIPHIVSDDLILPHMVGAGNVDLFNRGFTKISPFGSTVQATYISSLVTDHISNYDKDPILWETEAQQLDLMIQSFCSNLIPHPGKSVGQYCSTFGIIMCAAMTLNIHRLSPERAAQPNITSLASLALQSSTRMIAQSVHLSSTGVHIDWDMVAFWAHGVCARATLVAIEYNIPGVEDIESYVRFFGPRYKLCDNYLREIETAKAAQKAKTLDIST